MSGQAITEMMEFLRKHLDPYKMHGQAYDSAGNMSGKMNGAATLCLPLFKSGSCELAGGS